MTLRKRKIQIKNSIHHHQVAKAHQSDLLVVDEPKTLVQSLRLPKPVYDSQDSRHFVSRLRASCAISTVSHYSYEWLVFFYDYEWQLLFAITLKLSLS